MCCSKETGLLIVIPEKSFSTRKGAPLGPPSDGAGPSTASYIYVYRQMHSGGSMNIWLARVYQIFTDHRWQWGEVHTRYLTLLPKLYVRSSKCAVNYLEKWRRFYCTTEGTGIIVTLSPGTEYTGITLLWKMVTAKSTRWRGISCMSLFPLLFRACFQASLFLLFFACFHSRFFPRDYVGMEGKGGNW